MTARLCDDCDCSKETTAESLEFDAWLCDDCHGLRLSAKRDAREPEEDDLFFPMFTANRGGVRYPSDTCVRPSDDEIRAEAFERLCEGLDVPRGLILPADRIAVAMDPADHGVVVVTPLDLDGNVTGPPVTVRYGGETTFSFA